MASSLATQITLMLNSVLNNTIGVAAGVATVNQSFTIPWINGVAADQADKIYSATITRTHGAPAADLDLAGTLTDAFGATITMARLKALLIVADPANVNSVVVGGGATTPITSLFFDYVATADAQPAIKVAPGGILFLTAPKATAYVVTATTADKLQIASGDEDSTTSVTATVVAIGAST
jgi:hypothetical protein